MLVRPNGAETALTFLQQITVTPVEDLPSRMEAALTFRGYCGKDAMADIAGRFVVCLGTQREGLPSGAERAANAREGKALGLINIDDPNFTIEPPRWPFAYARTVKLQAPRETVNVEGTAFGYQLNFARDLWEQVEGVPLKNTNILGLWDGGSSHSLEISCEPV